MNKIIGVAANHRTVNYGTMLQAFAMQRSLESLGFQVETIALDGIGGDIRNRKLRYYLTQMKPSELLEAKLPFIEKKVRTLVSRDFRQSIAQRNRKFSAFREKRFPMSRVCSSREEMTELCGKYYAVLVGSDQVWLPSNIAADYLTLSFVPDSIQKVAYASSFGVDTLPKSQWTAASAFLNRLDDISVREQSGQKLVREIAGRDAQVVCDPSLLLTEAQWAREIPVENVLEEPYIFCYFLGGNPQARTFARLARKRFHQNLVFLPHIDQYVKEDEELADAALYHAGPEEFLNLIRNASLVITDSFHGTALSALHRKRVLIFNRFRSGAALSTNTRIDSICALLGLQEHRVLTERVEDAARYLDLPPVEDAAFRLDHFRRESWAYLRNALGGL